MRGGGGGGCGAWFAGVAHVAGSVFVCCAFGSGCYQCSSAYHRAGTAQTSSLFHRDLFEKIWGHLLEYVVGRSVNRVGERDVCPSWGWVMCDDPERSSVRNVKPDFPLGDSCPEDVAGGKDTSHNYLWQCGCAFLCTNPYRVSEREAG